MILRYKNYTNNNQDFGTERNKHTDQGSRPESRNRHIQILLAYF